MNINKFKMNKDIVGCDFIKGVAQFAKFCYVILAEEFNLMVRQYANK